MFQRSRHNNISTFIISQGYYDLPKKIIRANGNVYHNLKPNTLRNVQKIYQDKMSMDMTLPDFILLIFVCSN